MVDETPMLLSNNIVIRIASKRLYATFYVDTMRSLYELKVPSQMLELCEPYRHKDFHAYVGKASVTIVNVKEEQAEELTEKLRSFLTNPDNLEPRLKR